MTLIDNWKARTYVMGILNVTPDSFSGDGLLAGGRPNPLRQAADFLAAGADILDVGGESTRPGAEAVSETEELARVLPVIRAIRREFPEAFISIDTYRAAVADAALDAGARMVNDVRALRADPEMAPLLAQKKVPVVLMHNRLTPASAEVRDRLGGRYVGVPYQNLLEDVRHELLESVALAREAGVAKDRIILDPGLGFGKTVAQSLELLNRLDEFKALGYPLLIGPSRKSFIGYTLDLPPDERIEGTAAAVVIGIVRGANIVRVHDVPEIVRTARMADAILGRAR
ncbi:MAG TPA: dihydropteroate synthase [Anaerolineales bacterium]|nr:dihydropteroate synthase [Anaerolineales bacterium]